MSRHRQSRVERASARMPRRGECFAIASGKGGVGKTNLALNLGIHLSRSGLAVILVDADLGLANADILMNLAPVADISDAFDPTRPADAFLADGPEGLRVLCGVSGLARDGLPCEFQPGWCAGSVARLRRLCEVLLIDCAAGVTPAVIAFALACDRLILVTTPEPTALADAYATLKILRYRGFTGRVGLVVNMAESREQAERVAARLQRVAAQFLGLPVEDLGFVARDRHVVQAVCERVPVVVRYPHCAASACFGEICRRLRPEPATPAAAAGLWNRVAGLFL